MNIIDIFKVMQEDWAVLVFVFGLGGFWWQGKQWFSKVTDTLDQALIQHNQQTVILEHIQMKTDLLEERTDKIEITVNEIHNKIHEQEVKLAVLETVAGRNTRRATK